MKLSLSIPAVLLSAARLVLGDSCASGNFATFSDPASGVEISLAIPNVTAAPFPMFFVITAPLAVGWAGFATGGCMLRSPLVLAWRNGSDVVSTTKWATAYHPPAPYLNTTIHTVSSTVNATHWSGRVLCAEGCSAWYGGAIGPRDANATFGYGVSSHAPAAPADVASAIGFHDLAYGHFDMNLPRDAANGAASWAALTSSSSSAAKACVAYGEGVAA